MSSSSQIIAPPPTLPQAQAVLPVPPPQAQPFAVRPRVSRHSPYIVAIGGGKGGIGKSLISANLAVTLGRAGHRVTLFDADLGGANAHTCLGMPAPKSSVADFLRGRVSALGDVAVPTGYDNLRLISGALDWMQAANPKPAEKARLGDALLGIDTDILVIDLGAGTSLHTIDFFLLAHQGIIALIPEPTAIENAYRFMKMACIRRLQAIELSWHTRPLVARVLDEHSVSGLKSPAELLHEVRLQDPGLGARLKYELEKSPFALVVNQVRTEEEANLAEGMRHACRRYFGVAIDETISIPYEDTAWQAVRRRRPVVQDYPEGRIAQAIDNIVACIERKLS